MSGNIQSTVHTDITHSHDSHKKEALLGNTFMDEETEEQRG